MKSKKMLKCVAGTLQTSLERKLYKVLTFLWMQNFIFQDRNVHISDYFFSFLLTSFSFCISLYLCYARKINFAKIIAKVVRGTVIQICYIYRKAGSRNANAVLFSIRRTAWGKGRSQGRRKKKGKEDGRRGERKKGRRKGREGERGRGIARRGKEGGREKEEWEATG